MDMRERLVRTYAEAERFMADVPKFTTKNPMEETRGFYGYIVKRLHKHLLRDHNSVDHKALPDRRKMRRYKHPRPVTTLHTYTLKKRTDGSFSIRTRDMDQFPRI